MAKIIFLSIISFFASIHPLYISVTEIEHDKNSKILKVTMRIFIDDLETSIRKQINNPNLDITLPGEAFTTDELVENYLRKHFQLNVNGKEEKFVYLGHEVELPVIFVYVQTAPIKKIKEISVYNDMIMESYEDQTNIVHIEVNGDTRSLKLTENRREDSLSY